ncbi:MAG TPA: sialidase family protein [Candidatus Didemnitutus sp.]|nr:sialidase family protein [Candidatus Didemnitutus sp.]
MKKLVVLVVVFWSVIPVFGQSWKLLNPKLTFTILFNKQNSQSIWAGNWANQMYRSFDGGASWELVEIGSIDVLNFITSGVRSSLDSNVMILGGFGFDGIRRTSDAGVTWARVLTDSSPARARMYFISEALIEDTQVPGTFYGARGTTNNGIWKSTDDGATWDSISVIPSTFTTRLCTIAQRSDSNNILFVGCRGGVMARSDDNGRSWRRVPVLNGELSISSDAEIPKIVFSRRVPTTGYAVVAITAPDSIRDNGGLLKTVDGGATWNRIAFSDTSLWSVAVRDGADGKDDIFIGGFRTSNLPTLIIGDGLVYRSSNGGESWQRFDDIPWGVNEREDTIRNVWSLHINPTSNKVYMAAETGTFIFDEATSVTETLVPVSHATLNCTVIGNELIVRDLDPTDDHAMWTIYSMQGSTVGHGVIHDPHELHISTTSIPTGQYLLTWGSEQRFRTALFVVQK